MSRIVNEFQSDPQRVLERLVDGELSDQDRRELLSALDDEPAGWRRCALGFLEDQEWRGQLKRLTTEPAADLRSVQDARSAESARPFAVRRRMLGFHGDMHPLGLALAAGLLVAFVIGWQIGKHGAVPGVPLNPNKPDIATHGPTSPLPTVADHGGMRNAPAQWRTVKLGIENDADGRTRDIELPVVETSSYDPALLENQQSGLPGDLLDALRRSGHDVRQERQIWPVEMQDGRRLVVPVEQIDVRYTGDRSYQ